MEIASEVTYISHLLVKTIYHLAVLANKYLCLIYFLGFFIVVTLISLLAALKETCSPDSLHIFLI